MKLGGICMIISGLEAIKMHLKNHCFVYKQTKQSLMALFNYIVLQCIVFYDINLTISSLDRPITVEFTKGFS